MMWRRATSTQRSSTAAAGRREGGRRRHSRHREAGAKTGRWRKPNAYKEPLLLGSQPSLPFVLFRDTTLGSPFIEQKQSTFKDTLSPCQGRLPRRKYMNIWPRASKSSLRLCSKREDRSHTLCLLLLKQKEL